MKKTQKEQKEEDVIPFRSSQVSWQTDAYTNAVLCLSDCDRQISLSISRDAADLRKLRILVETLTDLHEFLSDPGTKP